MQPRSPFPLLAALWLATGAFAQSPTAVKIPAPPLQTLPPKTAAEPVAKHPRAAPRRDHHAAAATRPTAVEHAGAGVSYALPGTIVHDVVDGVAWAHGTTWKASFDAHSFTYVPFFGSQAERNWPLTLRLQQAHRGQTELQLSDSEPRRQADRIVRPRGACVEHFDLSPEAVEQSWVFATLPGEGDLRLQLGVTTDLLAHDLGSDLVFAGPAGSVRYEHAVAIDARGARMPLALDLVGDGIEIVVPAAFLAEVVLPLVVDPFTTTTPLTTTTTVQTGADLAFDYSTGEFLVVWQRLFSATDHDVWAQRLDLAQQPIGSPFSIDYTTVSWTKPRVANNGLADNFLVVAECSQGLVSPFWIGGRIWSLAGGALAPLTIERTGVGASWSGDALNPDVGGDPLELGPTYFTVVWEREYSPSDHDIGMRQLTSAGVLRAPAPTAIDLSTAYQSRPRISKSNGYSFGGAWAQQHWTIVYQQTYSPTDEDVRGSLVTWDGQFVGGVANHAVVSSSLDERAPVVSSPTDEIAGTRFHLIAFSGVLAGNDSDVFVQVWDRDRTARAWDDLQVLENAGGAATWPQGSPAVDCDGTRFVVTYTELWSGTGGDFDVRASTIAFDPASNQLATHEARALLAGSGDYEGAPAIASTWSGGGGPTTHGIAFHSADSSPAGYTVRALIYRGHAPLPASSVRPTACGGLGLSMSGLPALNELIQFAPTGSSPLQGCLFGTPVSVPLGPCPGCTLGVDGLLLLGPLDLVIPPQPTLVGLTFAVQGFEWANGPCFGTIALSDTIDFTIL
ncbi:MAG: hypothetical protein IT455_17095 [Planctomycetes bacterium]|nr:hypothetical protein [Planctomycetota bacterium]